MFQYSELIETHDKNVKEKRGEKRGGSLYIPFVTKSLSELPLDGDSRDRDGSSS